MSDTKAKLEAYRKRKKADEEKEAKKKAVWNALTLQPLRQRLTANNNEEKEDGSLEQENLENDTSEDLEIDDESDEEWKPIDWAILVVKFMVWLCLQVVFVKIEFGAVFFLFTGVFLMLTNMSKRRHDQMSAYSVFNPNCEAIDGTLTAQQFEREIRHGPTATN